MSTDQTITQPNPPISGAPQPHVADPQIPHVDIPHMGTSQTPIAPQGASHDPSHDESHGAPHAAPQPVPQAGQSTPPLPAGVSQADVDAAIRHVEQTGRTDGIEPKVLQAACAQIEAQAAQHGIDLNAQGQAGVAHTPQGGPTNYVEAAVMDKQSTFDNFHKQRDGLKAAVADQREAAQKPYKDALDKSASGSGQDATAAFDAETVQALAQALRDLDPETIALINAMGVLQDAPGVLKGVVWMEIVRALRQLIATETRNHITHDPETGTP